MARQRSAEEWKSEVAAWRARGESAATYARRRGYSVTSLFRHERGGPETGFVRLEVVRRVEQSEGLVVELDGVAIRVRRGFDAELLRSVVAALGPRGAK